MSALAYMYGHMHIHIHVYMYTYFFLYIYIHISTETVPRNGYTSLMNTALMNKRMVQKRVQVRFGVRHKNIVAGNGALQLAQLPGIIVVAISQETHVEIHGGTCSVLQCVAVCCSTKLRNRGGKWCAEMCATIKHHRSSHRQGNACRSPRRHQSLQKSVL